MKVSVIMPVYNAGRFLGDALDSIAKQTLSDFECICVDDGSSDSSAEIVRGYARSDPRFRLIGQPNAGPAAARNHGIDDSSGEYIYCIDADDVMPPKSLETLVELADKAQADVTWGQHRRFAESEIFKAEESASDSRVFSGEEWNDWFDAGFAQEKNADPFYGIPVVPWNKLIRRSSLGSLRFPVDRGVIGGDDIMFSAMLLPKMSVVAVSACVTYGYRIVGTSLNNIRAPIWLSRYSKAYVSVAEILRERPTALRNFALSALRPGFLRQALDAFVLTGRVKSDAEDAAEFQASSARLMNAYRGAVNGKMRLWLFLGAKGWWRPLAFLYKRSSLYRKSRDWSE